MDIDNAISTVKKLYDEQLSLVKGYRALVKTPEDKTPDAINKYCQKVRFQVRVTNDDITASRNIDDIALNEGTEFFDKVMQRNESIERAIKKYCIPYNDINDNQGGELYDQAQNLARLYIFLRMLKNREVLAVSEAIVAEARELSDEMKQVIGDAYGIDVKAIEERFKQIFKRLGDQISKDLEDGK